MGLQVTNLHAVVVTDARTNLHLQPDLGATQAGWLVKMCRLDHLRLSYRVEGRDYQLTDIQGNVVKEISA